VAWHPRAKSIGPLTSSLRSYVAGSGMLLFAACMRSVRPASRLSCWISLWFHGVIVPGEGVLAVLRVDVDLRCFLGDCVCMNSSMRFSNLSSSAASQASSLIERFLIESVNSAWMVSMDRFIVAWASFIVFVLSVSVCRADWRTSDSLALSVAAFRREIISVFILACTLVSCWMASFWDAMAVG